jgi:hypothetical protein
MNLRPYLRGALWCAAILLVVIVVAGVLWLAMAALGDQAGSQATKGVLLVAVVCLVLDLITLVVILAFAEITRPDRSAIDSDPPERPAS